MALIRLAYASKANFEERPREHGVEPHVARILMASRRNNPKRGLVGGLYYGDGFFFQCLEGESEEVHDLFNRLREDDRHREVTLLMETPINDYSFEDWSMKYVPVDEKVAGFLDKAGLERFNPFVFDTAMTEDMIGVLQNARDGLPATHKRAVKRSFEQKALLVTAAILIAGVVLSGLILF